MANYKTAKKMGFKAHFACEVCGKTKLSYRYEYQNHSYVEGYEPHYFKSLCRDCVYKKAFGSKIYKNKKKEGVLD